MAFGTASAFDAFRQQQSKQQTDCCLFSGIFRQKEIAMLVLTRKLNEQIRIGDDVTITVIRVKGNTVRLGIEAPRSTRVVRGELEPFDQTETGASSSGAADADQSSPENRSTRRAARPTVDHQDASPLAAYMPSKLNGVTAELSA